VRVSLPGWLAPLPDAEEMRAIDRWAIEVGGVPSIELMERAGAGLARVVEDHAPAGPVIVVCGKGNNGGDGLVAARLLREAGREAEVFCVTPSDELRGDARANLERLPGAAPERFGPEALERAAVIVDALLGTGTSGAPHGAVAAAITAIVARGAPVICADVPSGVDASTGAVAGPAVRAIATATFHAAKPGLWIAPGKRHAGAVHTIDLGIPEPAPTRAQIGLIGAGVLALIPRREACSTKLSSGAVALVGGSAGLTGAACLAAEAAMRAGAGYVTAYVPASLGAIFEQRLLEVMTVGLPDDGAALLPAGAAPVLELIRRGGSLVLGPGLGRTDGALALARDLAGRAPLPLTLDADGLGAFAGRLAELAARSAPTVLTPHAGELARLLEREVVEIEAQRLRYAREAAERARAVVVLKGDDTLVAEPGGRVAVNGSASPALATAGTGDVLAGAIGALLAKGMGAFEAACAGVHLHGLAGRLAAERWGVDGVVARDVIDALALVRRRVE